ncbi:ImmA/IrrE family metallo-endopeptidase [Aneurinibacillus thermoaerophilus]|uniref:ImmA/IrrE family metallo-endopeptidase n=1 Tax=Aneurinibacillus thermoaerophilus TaxID=143495 RepID=UPI002E220C1A|nr:ImmA/IrrE family metallo-endopeptidase [Aneurinibacillus thermoaerophilus]
MDIEQQVKKIVKKHKTICPFELTDYLNIHVRYYDLPANVFGLYKRVNKQSFIVLNQDHSYTIQRFTCAHELGHHFLHRALGYFFIEEHTLFHPGKFEREANRFAERLLTYRAEMIEGETIEQFYARHGIPKEIIGKI